MRSPPGCHASQEVRTGKPSPPHQHGSSEATPKDCPSKIGSQVPVKVAKQKEANHVQKRQARSNAVIEHLEALAEVQRKKKARPSALNRPIRDVPNPIQETKGKVKNKKKKTRATVVAVGPGSDVSSIWVTASKLDDGSCSGLRIRVDEGGS